MVLNWLMLQHKNTSIIIQISLKTWNISDSAGSSSANPPNFRGCYFLPSRASFELWMQRTSSFGTPSFSQLNVWQTSDRHGDLPRQNLTFPLHIVNKSLSPQTSLHSGIMCDLWQADGRQDTTPFILAALLWVGYTGTPIVMLTKPPHP